MGEIQMPITLLQNLTQFCLEKTFDLKVVNRRKKIGRFTKMLPPMINCIYQSRVFCILELYREFKEEKKHEESEQRHTNEYRVSNVFSVCSHVDMKWGQKKTKSRSKMSIPMLD